jgi:rhodanese-related sulfurtransferase
LRQLTVAELQQQVDTGAELVDVRPIQDFAAGHVRGALSIPLRPQFATWLGWLVPEGRRVAFVVGNDQDRAELIRQCLKVGYEDLAGELAAGVEAWVATGLPLERVALVSTGSIGENTVLDVRQASERVIGHLPGSLHIELGSLSENAAGLPPGPVTVMCAHGERAMTGASLLARNGRPEVAVLVGGPEEWADATGCRLAQGP